MAVDLKEIAKVAKPSIAIMGITRAVNQALAVPLLDISEISATYGVFSRSQITVIISLMIGWAFHVFAAGKVIWDDTTF